MQFMSKLSQPTKLVPNLGIIFTRRIEAGIPLKCAKSWWSSTSAFQQNPKRLLFTLTNSPPTKTNALRENNMMTCIRLSSSFDSYKSKPFATPKAVAKFHQMDGLSPKDFTLIYKTDFQWYMIIGQISVLLALGATITCLVAAFIEDKLPHEEQSELNLETQTKIMQSEKTARDEFSIFLGLKDPDKPEVVDNLPSLADTIAADATFVMIFFALLITLAGSIYKLMTVLPMRVYVGRKNHCVGVYYGSLIPGRLVRQDFVAGTLTPLKSYFGLTNTSFKDGSGRTMVLLEHFFRLPVDFDYLLGIKKSFEHEEDSDEFSQLKRIGAFGAGESKK